MLERFHVPSDEAVHVNKDDMHATVFDIFVKMRMPPDEAAVAADVFVPKIIEKAPSLTNEL